ncbi:hypothetical protein [Phenylobacterium sp.]|uniref:hypothetical protein n=1 Tax=Phenylobacterium sp. TaxID=1871053 RepID=UPI00120F217F|nr:hypothetical protein [Phenylobacterium sp.]THD61879.1 MAG: hypothetical protein E8A49_09190 [Phenylobacterium sp.]
MTEDATGALGPPDPPDKSRLAARISADYLLRSLKMIGELANGELLTGLVNLALVQANVSHLDRVSSGFDSLDSPPPDEVRRPVSILALSANLGLPYETTRRHVAKMVETGQCVRVKGGVIAPTAAVADPRRSEMLEVNLTNLRRLYRNLRAAGISLD